jgi:cytochrome P450
MNTVARDRLPVNPVLDRLEVLREFRTNPHGLLLRLATEHGDVVSVDIGRFRVFLLSYPGDVKDILVVNHARFEKGEVLQEPKRLLGEGLLTSEGDFHKRQRRLVHSVFHHTRMAEHVDLMVDCATRAAESWPVGNVVDVPDEMVRLTMSVLAKVVFDAHIEDEEARETGRALATCLGMFGRLASPYAMLLGQLPSRRNREFEQVLSAFNSTVDRLLEERRAKGIDGSDVVSQLGRAPDPETGETMPEQQVRDEIVTFMVAGHETWTNSLIWSWFLLSENPGVRQLVEAELEDVLADRPPTAEDVPSLRTTRAVYMEALRLYPPVWTVGRTALVDHRIGELTIPVGSIVLLSPYVVQHDPRWFPDPFTFRPERWLSGDAWRIPTFAYFPFGAGPRVCIGQPLAMLTSVVFLAAIARRRRLDLVPGHPVEPAPPLLRPAHGLPMIARAVT